MPTRPTRKGALLAQMEELMPWPVLCALINPMVHPNLATAGRSVWNWFNLSDLAVEKTL